MRIVKFQNLRTQASGIGSMKAQLTSWRVFSGRKVSWVGTRYDHLLTLDTYNWFMCYPKGMGAQILKAVLSQGVLFMSRNSLNSTRSRLWCCITVSVSRGEGQKI